MVAGFKMYGWDLVAEGKCHEALETMQHDYVQSGHDASTAIDLGALYLWMNEWDEVGRHFDHYASVHRWTYDFASIFPGTAKWCAGEYEAAVTTWRKGLKADYADSGGGVLVRLHLYFAAVVRPESMKMSEALALLRQLVAKKKGNSWPMYLAKIALGSISHEEIMLALTADIDHLWGDRRDAAFEDSMQNVDFWLGVSKLASGDHEAFVSAMKRFAHLDYTKTPACRSVLIDKLRNSVYYLARNEAKQGRAGLTGLDVGER